MFATTGTRSRQGADMRRVLRLAWVLAVAAALFGSSGASVAAAKQDAGDGLGASIHAGRCGGDPGAVVAALTDPSVPTGDAVGAEGAQTAATSFTTVAVSLDGLLAADHAITVLGPDGDDEAVACGAIGGVLAEAGSLTIVVAEENGSGVSAIAFLAPNAADPQAADVSLFVDASNLPERGDAEADDDADAGGGEADEETPVVEDEGQNEDEDGDEPTGFTAEELAYAKTVGELATTVGESLERASELFGNPQIGDTEWMISVAGVLATWQVAYQQAQEITPPPAFEEIHATMLEGLALLNSSADNIATGLDTFDVTLINQAAEEMAQAAERIAEATRQLNELREERGG